MLPGPCQPHNKGLEATLTLIAQKPFIVPIPGTRNPKHLSENLGAIQLALNAADLTEIDTAFARMKIYGGRMNADQMRIVDATT